MGFRKKILGISDYTFDILIFMGLLTREYQTEYLDDDGELQEIWEVWEWMVFQGLQNGSVSNEQFLQIYGVVDRQVNDFKYEYQKDNQEVGRQFALLYSDIQKVLYPNLRVAFLPKGYGSEVKASGVKPGRYVRIEGFGESIPEEIIEVIEKHNFKIKANSSQELLVNLCSAAFVKTVIGSNEKGRLERVGLRASAYAVLPFFICFELFKFRKSD
jgi:hypothetical protein